MAYLFKGVIFDFNGTLFFDSDKHEKAWKKISMELRSYPVTDEEIATNIHGRTNKSIFNYLLQREITEEILDSYISKKEQYYRQLCLQDAPNLRLVDGAKDFINSLHNDNVKTTIATASEITNVTFFNKQFGLDRWFDFDKIVYDDGKTKGKPAPDMFIKAAQNLSLNPSECVVFEDSASGIAAAKKAKINKIIIIDPAGENSSFRKNPDVALVIPDFNNIKNSLSRLF